MLHRMDNEQKKKVTNNVIGNSEKEKIESIFAGLGQNWQSFVNNRLPLLKLPDELLEALRQGNIAYTKAKAISAVKDEAERKELLENAPRACAALPEGAADLREIANSLSLSQIR